MTARQIAPLSYLLTSTVQFNMVVTMRIMTKTELDFSQLGVRGVVRKWHLLLKNLLMFDG